MPFQHFEYDDPFSMLTGGMKFGQDYLQNMRKNPLELKQMQLVNALKEYQRQQEEARSPFYKNMAKSENDLASLAPQEHRQKMAELSQQMQYNPQRWQSEMNLQGAQTNKMNTMTPLEAEETRLKNKSYPDYIRSQIAANNSLAGQRESGTAGMGTGGKEELMFQNFVEKDNPQLKTPAQIYEASNVLREGGNQLSDGTPLNPLSPAARSSLDRIYGGTTTSANRTALISGTQAEAEINVLSKFAQNGLKEYGYTYANMNPRQIYDTLKSDPKSQKKLGKLIAAQQLQYEIAQNEIKLSNGEPGVTSTHELMQIGQQMLNLKFPKLSYEARKEANSYFLEALKEGLEARKKAGISISKALEKDKSNKTNAEISSMSDEDLLKIVNGG